MGFWSIALFIMIGALLYIGWRARQAFVAPAYKKHYWLLFFLLITAFVLLRSITSGLAWMDMIITWAGSYFMGLIYYAFLLVLLIDIIRTADSWLGFIPPRIKQKPARVGLGVLLVLAIILAYGTWNAWNPVITPYEITIPNKVASQKELHAVMVSDLHLGTIVGRERLDHIVSLINEQKPDLVLLAGDVIDGDPKPFLDQGMNEVLGRLKPRLGTFMVLGNHDGRGTSIIPHLQAAGITVLRDQYQLVDGRFYVVGRDNRGHQFTRRTSLGEVLKGVDMSLPVILLDHNPAYLDEALLAGVDLQLSGHTHQGQMFPNNFIIKSMYEIDWGHLRKDTLQVLVSTGVGTWGPPIRIGNSPELVDIRIRFAGGN